MRLITQPSLESVFVGSEGVWAGDPRRGDRAPPTCMEVLPYCPLPPVEGGNQQGGGIGFVMFFKKQSFLHSDGEGGGQEETEAEGVSLKVTGRGPLLSKRAGSGHVHTPACRRAPGPAGVAGADHFVGVLRPCLGLVWLVTMPLHPGGSHHLPQPALPVSSYSSLPALRTLRPPVS